MTAAVAQLKDEWRQFLHDPPGRRFQKHRERMKRRSRVFAIGLMVLGIVLLVAGVMFLFIPGPGIPLIMFGLGLVAGESRRLAALLDRAEPRIRMWARAARDRWQTLPSLAKAAITLVVAAAIAAVIVMLWRTFVR